MFNFLVKYSGWALTTDRIAVERLLEYTDDATKARFTRDGRVDLEELIRLPAVFVEETNGGANQQVVRIGTIVRAFNLGRDINLDYVFDTTLPAITNDVLEEMASELGIVDWEFTRTHWAVKDTDLFRALIRRHAAPRTQPRVFKLEDPPRIEPKLVAAMMPFEPAFDGVYQTLKEGADSIGLYCRRADDIWENPAIMQDVVSLIDHARVVVCDCTGRNPNVFYEAGIAHTLGKEVILITQSEADIPFDLRHLRYVKYLNNGEGRTELKAKVSTKLGAMIGRG